MDELAGKKLLMLGGSRNMKEILDAAHEMGVWVGVTDWYTPERSPVKRLADAAYDISIEDHDALSRLIREAGYDGVITGFTDSYLVTYAELCRRNGLPSYGTPEQFRILTDKAAYKKRFADYGVPALTTYDAATIDETFAHFPIMMKPVTGSGGKGLVTACDYREFLAKKVPDTTYMIEPYLPPDRQEMTAFFLFVDGKVYLTGTANRLLSKPQGEKIGLPVLYSLPSTHDALFRRHTAPALVALFEDMGLRDGMLFAQCFIHGGQAQVYDVGYRLTGSLEYKLLDRLYGINPLKMMIRHSLTGHMLPPGETNLSERLMRPGYGFNVTVLGREGTLAHFGDREAILALPGVLDCAFKLVPGERITPAMVGTLGQIVARIFFTATDLDEAATILREIYHRLDMTDVEGRNMLLDTYDPDDLVRLYAEGSEHV